MVLVVEGRIVKGEVRSSQAIFSTSTLPDVSQGPNSLKLKELHRGYVWCSLKG